MGGVFMTGFPGFIAGRLVSRLIEAHPEGTKFLFLVEPRFVHAAADRCRALEADHPGFAGTWHVLEGDIRLPDLGMSDDALALARDVVTRVWHLAALYDLACELPIAYAVNVDGTLRVLDFCETLPGLNRLLYVSTCYVAGDRTGRVYEDELDMGQGFKNHYESTKCWAEKHVRNRIDKVPATIFRPGIVVGDSQTGETAKGDGPYYVMQLLLRTPRWLPMVNLGRGAAKVNLVPVDWLVEAMVTLATSDAAEGRTFHLADPDPLTAAQILEEMVEELGRSPVIGSIPKRVAKHLLRRRRISRALGVPAQVLPYFNHPVEFDVSNTTAELEPAGLPCPRFTDVLPNLIEYARSHPGIFAEVA